MNDLIIRTKELFDNPTPRVPVCLVLDTSSSMSGEPINELNMGVELFLSSLKNDNIARYSAEIAVVTFASAAEKILDFQGVDNQTINSLRASGCTSMGEGVELALDVLDQRKHEYSESGVDYYQPWMILMTDGGPTDDISRSVQRTQELVNKKKLTVFPIGIGGSADMSVLQQFSPNRPPLKLKGLKFDKFFEWLSKSVARVSASTPGDSVKLDIDGISAWGEI